MPSLPAISMSSDEPLKLQDFLWTMIMNINSSGASNASLFKEPRLSVGKKLIKYVHKCASSWKPFLVLFYFDSRQLNRDLRNQKHIKNFESRNKTLGRSGWMEFRILQSFIRPNKLYSRECRTSCLCQLRYRYTNVYERKDFSVPLRLLEQRKKFVKSPKKNEPEETF